MRRKTGGWTTRASSGDTREHTLMFILKKRKRVWENARLEELCRDSLLVHQLLHAHELRWRRTRSRDVHLFMNAAVILLHPRTHNTHTHMYIYACMRIFIWLTLGLQAKEEENQWIEAGRGRRTRPDDSVQMGWAPQEAQHLFHRCLLSLPPSVSSRLCKHAIICQNLGLQSRSGL
jgi:hypothetical protein